MNKRLWIVGVIIVLVVPCAIYDLRPYIEYNPQEQHKSKTVICEMHTNSSSLRLDLSESLTYPSYNFSSFEISEILVEQINVSTSTLGDLYMTIRSYDFPGVHEIHVTSVEYVVIMNLPLITDFTLRITLVDPSEVFTNTNIPIGIEYIIDCAFIRPPKHTISGMVFNTLHLVDPRNWIFIVVLLMAIVLIHVSRKLQEN